MKNLSRKIRHKLGFVKQRLTKRVPEKSEAKKQDPFAKHKLSATQASAAKQWVRAETLWQRYITASGDNAPPEAYRQLSVSQRSQLKYEQAAQTITAAQIKHPDDLSLTIELAEIAASSKNWPEAVNRWQAIVQKNPDTKATPKYIARLVYCLGMNGDYPSAFKIAERGLAQFPANKELLLVRAHTFFADQKWQQASGAFEQTLKQHGALPADGWVAFVQSLRKNGDYVKAERTVQEALSQTDDPQLRIEWAEIATQQQDWKVAAARWRELAEATVNNESSVDENLKLHIRFNESVVQHLLNSDKYIREIKHYSKRTTKRKYVICTAFSAGYDTLKLPAVIDDRFDYVAYTDENVNGFGVYDVRPFPVKEKDNGRTIRYIKMHPHELFSNYEAVIWIDSSILIAKSLYPLLEKFLTTGKPIASTPHQHRQTIQEELEACILRKKDDPVVMKKQVAQYEKSGFDGKILAENGLLMFNIKNKLLPSVMNTWWQEVQRYSKRDQLSFGYALFKNHADWHHIVDKPLHIRNMPEIVLTAHHDTSFALTKLNEAVGKHV